MDFTDIQFFDEAVDALYGDRGYRTEDGFSNCVLLDKQLGMSEYRLFYVRPSIEDTKMAEDLKKLLVMLAGPHGKAILKAYRIQKGLES